jgi:hypothetical protein
MAHGDAREEKWRGKKRKEWVTSKRHMTAEHKPARAVQNQQGDVHSSPASSRLNWRPCRFKGLVCYVERRNLVSARVSSHFKSSIQPDVTLKPPFSQHISFMSSVLLLERTDILSLCRFHLLYCLMKTPQGFMKYEINVNVYWI